MVNSPAIVSLGFVFLAVASAVALPAESREKRAVVSLSFNTSDISYPPTREEIDAALKQAAEGIMKAIDTVEDPNTNITMQAPLKRDTDSSVALTAEHADLSAAEDDSIANFKRNRPPTFSFTFTIKFKR